MSNGSFDPLSDSVSDQDSDDDKIPTGPSAFIIVNCILNVPLLVLSILGNTMVLAGVLKTSSLRSPSIIFLCGLAVSDLVVGLIVQPIYIARELTSLDIFVRLTKSFGNLFCGISFATMSGISVDRFLALQFHMTYSNLVTTSRVKICLILIWLINSGLNIWYTPTNFHLALAMVGVYILASTISYIGIYRIVRRHNAEIYAQKQALEYPNNQNVYRLAMLTRTAINTFVFYISTILCYLPWLIYTIFYRDIFPIGAQEAWVFTVTLVFANSAINPFLYCWRIRDLRKAVVKISRQKTSCK